MKRITGKYLEIFAQLSGVKSTGPGDFIYFYISQENSLNLALISAGKLDGHLGTWNGCVNKYMIGILNVLSKQLQPSEQLVSET